MGDGEGCGKKIRNSRIVDENALRYNIIVEKNSNKETFSKMDAKQLKIKIKYGADKVFEISIALTDTVSKLKEELTKLTTVQPSDQKLIFKGIIIATSPFINAKERS